MLQGVDSHISSMSQLNSPNSCGIIDNSNALGYAEFTDETFLRFANQNRGHSCVMLEYCF